ncbi:MAG: TIGR04283 family arsenosugar biosynthesis glycosyltransferase, partial [Pseudomonadota bacterium]
PACLEALTPGLSTGLIREVLVCDGGSQDHTLVCAGQAGCRIVSGSSGRGRQLRAGGHAAKGDWLLFIHADTRLETRWADAIQLHMSSAPAKAASFELAYDSDAQHARWLERRVALRTRWLALPYGDQGLLISRALYEEIGGFKDLPLMEDVDIVRRIGRERLSLLDCRSITSADKYERDGWRKRAWRNSWLVIRYFLGASPKDLAKLYD